MKNIKILLIMIVMIGVVSLGVCQESIKEINLMKVKEVVSQRNIPYVSYIEDEINRGYVQSEAIYPVSTDIAIPQGATLKIVFIDANGVETSQETIELHGEAIFDMERLFETKDISLAKQTLASFIDENQPSQSYFLKSDLQGKTSPLDQAVTLTPVAASISTAQATIGTKVDYESGLWLLTSRTLGQAPSQQTNKEEISGGTILKKLELPKNIK